jgi:hypothetical protein
MPKVSPSMWAAPEASSRSMIGGNQGRAAAASTIVTIQASSLVSAESAPWAMVCVRAPTARNMSRSTSTYSPCLLP